MIECPSCHGTGGEMVAHEETCVECAGVGCPACNNQGTWIWYSLEICASCGGTGLIKAEEEFLGE